MTRLSQKAITEASMEELPKGNLDTRFSNRIAFGLGVKYSESIYIPQIEKLQGEIADLRFRLQYAQSPFQGFVAIDKYEQLTAKHERLVKASYKFNGYILMNPVKGFDVPDDIYKPFVKALTESEGE